MSTMDLEFIKVLWKTQVDILLLSTQDRLAWFLDCSELSENMWIDLILLEQGEGETNGKNM